MKRFTQSLTITGKVDLVESDAKMFVVRCRSGDTFEAFVGPETSFEVVRNLDELDHDRFPDPPSFKNTPEERIAKYLRQDTFVSIEGVLQEFEGKRRYDCRTVHLVTDTNDCYLFERTHWWLTQTKRLADQWLDSLFGDRRDYDLDDFVRLYRTNLNVEGLPTDDVTQECAVLSRLIYGFSAAYLLTGDERYRSAASAGVRFQREAFRSLSHDGRNCFWAYGRRRTRYGTQILVPSESSDDRGSIALYEQIYALAGLAQYYRVSLDWEVLEDIRRTIRTFKEFYHDEKRDGDQAFTGARGWFSHIDYATLRPDRNPNPANNCKKNWNSIGDHIPAYLVNILLAIGDDDGAAAEPEQDELRRICVDMLDEATTLILDKFAGSSDEVGGGMSPPYVNERFNADWTPDHAYSWQKNRAIVGHNFKISWNLTRVANYYDTVAERPGATRDHRATLAGRCLEFAEQLAAKVSKLGIDSIRGGCFDALERMPSNGMPIEFTWMNTKDFWQQEQAILAYLILYGRSRKSEHRDLARETEAFWNLYFLDRDHRGMHFRVTDNGVPIQGSSYGVRGGHSDASGYHCFELNYLAHVYNRMYMSADSGTDATFCLYFLPSKGSRARSINVLPDFVPAGHLKITRVTADGVPRSIPARGFRIPLLDTDLGREIMVEFEVVPEAGKTA